MPIDKTARLVYNMAMENASTETVVITGRIAKELAKQVRDLRKRDPYAPSVSRIVARGVELALKELEAKRGANARSS